MPVVGRITVDGKPVGIIQVDLNFGDVPTYPPGLDTSPLSHGPSEPEADGGGFDGGGYGGSGGRGDGGHEGRGRQGPTFRPGVGPGARHAPVEHGPTFRHGLHPRGEAPPAKPEHYSVADVKSALERDKPGAPDRSRIAKELEGNEPLQRRYAQMVKGEVMGYASTHARIVQAETAANRALKRGHSLEEALWDTRHHGQRGYYPERSFTRSPLTEEEFAEFKRNVLPQVLAGSDYAKGYTGNASAGVAARQIARGTPHMDLRSEGGDIYFDEDVGRTMPRQPVGKPVGVTRLGPDPSYRPTDEAGRRPVAGAPVGGAETAVGGGPPAAFIMHHTGGGGTVAGVQATLRQRGLGVQYIMDRDGKIHHVGGPGSAHIMTGWGQGAGLSNRNVVGMEVIARDDRDVTPAQVAAGARFIREHYPNTPVYGHGEVNPGHKEAEEGMSIVRAIRAERSRLAAPERTKPPGPQSSLEHDPFARGHSSGVRVASSDPTFVPASERGAQIGSAGQFPSSLVAERGRFARELQNPAVRERLFHLTQTENPQNPTAFMENVMNRASARKTSLLHAMNDPHYYPHISLVGARPDDASKMSSSLETVLSGSNITKYATGNASGKVGFGYGQGAKDPHTYVDPVSGERYGVENQPTDIAWARRMRGE